MMEAATIVAIATGSVACLGVVGSYIRNGRSQSRHAGKLEQKIDQVINKQEEEREERIRIFDAIDDVKVEISSFRIHCSEVSTGIIGRVNTNERDIKELKAKR